MTEENQPPQHETPKSSRIHAIIHGRVQGVFFRAFTQQNAHRLNIKGWVRNRAEGTVEVVAEGLSDDLEEFEKAINKGPPGCKVDKVDLAKKPNTGEFQHFIIKPTLW
ncbi:MAG: acylphosphatase [Candidatus Ranarchaeia archaeon]|jgi:acylphosphatase